jgi:uncharacterized membrane protein
LREIDCARSSRQQDHAKTQRRQRRKEEINQQLVIGNRKSPILFWLVVVFGSLVFLTLIFGAPLLLADNHRTSATIIYGAFSKICHQKPERSFFVLGSPLAVCSRCTGLYVGFTLTLVAYPLLRSLRTTTAPDRKWLFLAAVPMALDVAVDVLGIWHNTHSSRVISGLVLGAAGVFYVMPGISELALRVSRPRLARVLTPVAPSGPIPSTPSDYSAPHRRI